MTQPERLLEARTILAEVKLQSRSECDVRGSAQATNELLTLIARGGAVHYRSW